MTGQDDPAQFSSPHDSDVPIFETPFQKMRRERAEQLAWEAANPEPPPPDLFEDEFKKLTVSATLELIPSLSLIEYCNKMQVRRSDAVREAIGMWLKSKEMPWY